MPLLLFSLFSPNENAKSILIKDAIFLKVAYNLVVTLSNRNSHMSSMIFSVYILNSI